MSVYLSVCAVVVFLSILSWSLKSNIPVILVGIILALFAGMRVQVGFDFFSYQNVYAEIQNGIALSSIGHFEIGYLILNWIAVQLSLSFNGFLIFFCLITFGLLIVFLILLKDPQLGSMALLYYFSRFYFTRDFGQIRASLAAVICLLAFFLLLKHHFGYFVIVILIASLFQKVALVFFVAYVVMKVFKKRVNIVSFPIVAIFTAILSEFAGSFLQNHVSVFDSYSDYLTNAAFTDGGSGLANSVIWFQLSIGILCLYLFFQHNIQNAEQKVVGVTASIENVQKIIVVYLIGTLILLLFNTLPTAAGRVSTVLNTFEIIVVPLIFQRMFKGVTQIIAFSVFSVAVWYLFFVHAGVQFFIPYHSIFG
ncbi:EpsG family protein [Lactiplantibacillus pingfangensis]|uniref:EpsG family protein n=1 Tax=Lactiplantibacillus pingfangensis TaxID=2559915 RepID=UPI0010F84362|nr:EpsG family protein [Lactiplantibacillus pingfangensis]